MKITAGKAKHIVCVALFTATYVVYAKIVPVGSPFYVVILKALTVRDVDRALALRFKRDKTYVFATEVVNYAISVIQNRISEYRLAKRKLFYRSREKGAFFIYKNGIFKSVAKSKFPTVLTRGIVFE